MKFVEMLRNPVQNTPVPQFSEVCVNVVKFSEVRVNVVKFSEVCVKCCEV